MSEFALRKHVSVCVTKGSALVVMPLSLCLHQIKLRHLHKQVLQRDVSVVQGVVLMLLYSTAHVSGVWEGTASRSCRSRTAGRLRPNLLPRQQHHSGEPWQTNTLTVPSCTEENHTCSGSIKNCTDHVTVLSKHPRLSLFNSIIHKRKAN